MEDNASLSPFPPHVPAVLQRSQLPGPISVMLLFMKQFLPVLSSYSETWSDSYYANSNATPVFPPAPRRELFSPTNFFTEGHFCLLVVASSWPFCPCQFDPPFGPTSSMSLQLLRKGFIFLTQVCLSDLAVLHLSLFSASLLASACLLWPQMLKG